MNKQVLSRTFAERVQAQREAPMRNRIGVRMLLPMFSDLLAEWIHLENIGRYGNRDIPNVDRNDAINLALEIGMEEFEKRVSVLREAQNKFQAAKFNK